MKTPHEMAEERVKMAAVYSRYSEMLEHILETKPAKWSEIRTTCKSDKQADQLWDASGDGIQEMKLRMALKRFEKTMSANATMLRVMEQEARNQI
jgi:hypothetical protein